MGFKSLNDTAIKKKAFIKRILLVVGAVLLGVLTLLGSFAHSESWKYYFFKPDIAKRKDGELRIHFLDVGQGDCSLIELPDGKVMLIDGGNSDGDTKKTLMRYLNALDIDVVDYLLVTHTDADHCGALTEVFEYKKVLNAYLPPTYDVWEGTYGKVYTAALEEGCARITPSRSVSFASDSAYPYSLRILYPYDEEFGEVDWSENESSAVLWLNYQEIGALFCSDAPTAVENKLILEDRFAFIQGVSLSDTEIVKVSHHGSKDASSQEFLEYLGVETAIVSCGKDNAYNHPSQEVLNRLKELGATTYRTDEQGHILVTITKNGEYTVQTIEK